MFDVFLDYFKKLFKSRLFPITLIYLVLFCVVINRLFVLQIVNGPAILQKDATKDTKNREIEPARGNIYDRNGKLLATNKLNYSVILEDSTKATTNEQRNTIVDKVIKLVEQYGDTLDNEFYIIQNKDEEFEFTIEGTALMRFKEKAYAWVLVDKELTEDQKNSSAEEVYEFLRTGAGYTNSTDMFGIADSYSVEETLKIMSVRYALFCNYPKYIPITVASNVNDKTITAIKENSDVLLGVDIEQQLKRSYVNSIYFSNIIGYTGLISTEELDVYNEKEDVYDSTDIVGKTGLEKKYEEYLRGIKGTETVSVSSTDKVIDVIKKKDPVAGNDIYLTINSDLQIASYKLLERELANILLENITPNMDYGSKGKSASDILIPIYEVYFALINNNVIDINHFSDSEATTLEKKTYNKYKSKLKSVFKQLDSYLSFDNKVTNDKAGDMEDYLDYFYQALRNNDLIIKDSIPSDDATYTNYVNDKISLSSFLQTALANNWIDLSKLEVGDEYYSTEELYNKLIDKMKEDILKSDDKFKKMIYKNLVFSYNLSGSEICLLLFDQGVLEYKESDVNKLKSNSAFAYTFITKKIDSMVITPAMLALTPCSGSVVITDVNTGDVLALVTYPSYDNNKFAGKIDAEYFNKVNNDLTTPLRNLATSRAIEPGSTFKMVTSVAALEEGVITPDKRINDLGEFDRINPPPHCHIFPGSHGSVNLMDALAVSCNYYFFEMGWRLSIDGSGKYKTEVGLATLKKYATKFGLNEASGIELSEKEPTVSTTDSIRSSIGQGSNLYTPVQLSRYVTTLANSGTCYDLTLLDKIVDNDDSVIKDNSATVNHTLEDVKTSTWDAVQEGMYDVVNSSKGSVYSTFKDMEVKVAGKTGTSQINKFIPNNALFVSYAPYKDPKISVTVVIPNGYTSHNAALLAKNIYSFYFGYKDADTLLKDEATEKSNSSTIE